MSSADDQTTTPVGEQPWARDAEAILADLDVAPDHGLDRDDARRRRRRGGPNRIEQQQRASALTVLVNQFRSVIVIVLGAAAVVTFAFQQWAEGIAISAVVVVNALIGFVTELRAVRAMEALDELGRSRTRVRRGGQVREIAADHLVPGDIVVLEAGDTVAADLRVLESARLQADESTLTGESEPVAKQREPVAAEAPLAERKSLLFKGTAITSGSGQAVVVATGMDTELGAISRDIREAEDETTPLEERLDQLGRAFIWLTVALSAIVVVVGWLQDRDLLLVVESGVALAVAAIPEGLPIVATIALARGMRRMAAKNALVNRLAAVETLGGATVIATDKTGTLTENRMTVVRLVLPDRDLDIGGAGLEPHGDFTPHDDDREGGESSVDPADHATLREALTVGALCTNAELAANDDGEPDAVGDPMEIALLVAARKAGLEREALLAERPEEREVAFDPDRKLMATLHRDDEALFAAVKGAPDAVLAVCSHRHADDGQAALADDEREAWRERSRALAAEGLRVLALARGRVDDPEADPYHDLVFLGLVGLVDPPRRDVKDTIATARRAGIRTVMVTGDQAATARAVAEALDLAPADAPALAGRELQAVDRDDPDDRRRLLDTAIFARVSPRQKLDLVDLLQDEGNVVAMTGDGVNDAPALEKADIGVAMGRRGTQVAREAADIILEDDDFGTLVTAIREGRIIFGNLRQFVLFLLSVSLSMILAVFAGSLAGLPMPVLPLQILFLNAVTHVFPALALGLGEGLPGVMNHPPRDPSLPVLQRGHWAFVWVHAVLIAAASLAALLLARGPLGLPDAQAQTVAFLAIALAQLWHVFNVRGEDSGLLVNEVTRNRYVWLAVVLSLALTAGILVIDPVARVMRVTMPDATGWLLAIGLSLLPVVAGWLYAWRFGGARIATAADGPPGA